MAIENHEIDCNGNKHKLSVETFDIAGQIPIIRLPDHSADEIEAEAVLQSMNGEICGCLKFVNEWRGYHKAILATNDGARWEVTHQVVEDAL